MDKVTIYYFPKNSSKLRHAMEDVGITVPLKYYMGMVTVLVVKNSVVVFVGNTQVNHIEQIKKYTGNPNVELEKKTLSTEKEFYSLLVELKI